MNNRNKIILGIVISYFVVVSFLAIKMKRTDTGQPADEDDSKEEKEEK
jgi:hypothetical protein